MAQNWFWNIFSWVLELFQERFLNLRRFKLIKERWKSRPSFLLGILPGDSERASGCNCSGRERGWALEIPAWWAPPWFAHFGLSRGALLRTHYSSSYFLTLSDPNGLVPWRGKIKSPLESSSSTTSKLTIRDSRIQFLNELELFDKKTDFEEFFIQCQIRNKYLFFLISFILQNIFDELLQLAGCFQKIQLYLQMAVQWI